MISLYYGNLSRFLYHYFYKNRGLIQRLTGFKNVPQKKTLIRYTHIHANTNTLIHLNKNIEVFNNLFSMLNLSSQFIVRYELSMFQ